jgi:hypothetical protein
MTNLAQPRDMPTTALHPSMPVALYRYSNPNSAPVRPCLSNSIGRKLGGRKKRENGACVCAVSPTYATLLRTLRAHPLLLNSHFTVRGSCLLACLRPWWCGRALTTLPPPLPPPPPPVLPTGTCSCARGNDAHFERKK